MKALRYFLLCFLAAILLKLPLCAQNSYCPNIGFELGNFSNWKGFTWQYSKLHSINTSKIERWDARRHAIMKDPNAFDANTGYNLRIVPPGYKFSIRLGDAVVQGDPRPRCWQQSLQYQMTIDSSSAILILKFAVVLEYLSTHAPDAEPRFRLRLFDQKGDPIPGLNYDFYATNNAVDGFKLYSVPGSATQIQWRDWSTIAFNLLKYCGQTITIDFVTADCTEAYHFGYAYIVAECRPLQIKVKNCSSDTIASLIAPEGFISYQWTDNNGIEVGQSQIIQVPKIAGNGTYSCTMVSAEGIKVTLRSTVNLFEPLANFTYRMSCDSNTVQFSNKSSAIRGLLNYKWDFGDGVISTHLEPKHIFSASGFHPVELIVYNPPSTCTDTFRREVESFSGSMVGIAGDSTCCPDQSVLLKAYGAQEYIWNNGLKNSSLEVSSPGGTVWVLGKNSSGICMSDTIYRKITDDPEWSIYPSGDTVFCAGKNTVLKASGAESYRWSNGKTEDSIFVTSPGKYKVTGVNKRGCEKSLAINVIESPLPEVDYTFSPHILNGRQSQISCSIPAQDGVQYTWDMGDGTTGYGPEINYTYNINYEIKQYEISLKATNRYGCVDSIRQIVDVIPFIPNVFSPNGDGINDLFMPGIETQVFDRNGMQLYHGNNGWDGRYNGQLLSPDTYFYVIHYLNRMNEIQTKKGYITLVR